jgi:hypothetical protein
MLGERAAPGVDRRRFLAGGDLSGWIGAPQRPDEDFERFVAAVQQRHPWLPGHLARRLARAYGARIADVLGDAASPWPTWAPRWRRACTSRAALPARRRNGPQRGRRAVAPLQARPALHARGARAVRAGWHPRHQAGTTTHNWSPEGTGALAHTPTKKEGTHAIDTRAHHQEGGRADLAPRAEPAPRSGAVTVLLGATQAGKTSLMRIMAGLDTPTTGRVLRRRQGRDRACRCASATSRWCTSSSSTTRRSRWRTTSRRR